MKTLAVVAISFLALATASADVVGQDKFSVGFFVSAATCTQVPADISGSGQGHFVDRVTVDNTGSIHVGFTFNAQGTASDANGNQYVFNDADSFTLSGPAGGFETTITEHFHLIGKGGAPNVKVKALLHITVLANGTVTAFVDKASGNEACEGII